MRRIAPRHSPAHPLVCAAFQDCREGVDGRDGLLKLTQIRGGSSTVE